MKTKKKTGGSAGPGSPSLLPDLARQILAGKREQPDRWIIHANETGGKQYFLCASPPFPMWSGSAGPLLGRFLENSISLAALLISDGSQFEGVVAAGSGFLAPLMVEALPGFGPDDFPPGLTGLVHLKRQAGPPAAIRTALETMLQLGQRQLSAPFTAAEAAPPGNRPGKAPPIEFVVRRDGSLAMGSFGPEATLGQLSEALSASAAKARLTRLRQSASNCGGCGRCCYDGDIPLTYFDLRSVAAHHFVERYRVQPEMALSETRALLASPRAGTPDEKLPFTRAPRLLFRKKDGTSSKGSPCIFLDGRGLCGVYAGRPLLCRLYHCAHTTPAVESLVYSTFNNLEWLGRAVESEVLRPDRPVTLDLLLEQPLIRLASPYALSRVIEETRPKV